MTNNTPYIPLEKNNKWNNLLTPLRPRPPVTSINRSFREESMKHVEPQHKPQQLGYAYELLLVAAFIQFVGGFLSESWESNLFLKRGPAYFSLLTVCQRKKKSSLTLPTITKVCFSSLNYKTRHNCSFISLKPDA